jgi:hypothetical protein
MWLYLLAAVLLLFGIVGSIFSGGIFTIVVLPVGAVVLLVALVVAAWARGSHASSGEAGTSEPRPLPHTDRPQPGAAGTTSPEELADARFRAQ